MDQWFVSLDKDGLRQRYGRDRRSLFHPRVGKKPNQWILESGRIMYLEATILNIPVFFDEDGNALLDSKLIHFLADKVSKLGCNVWFSNSAEELLDGFDLPEEWKEAAE